MQLVKNKKVRLFLSILVISLFILVGCSQKEEFDSFSLEQIDQINLEDTENPTMYIVSPDQAIDEVTVIRNQVIDAVTSGSEIVEYELKETSVTDDEIVIKYEGEEDTFGRISSTVAVNENGIQYQYEADE